MSKKLAIIGSREFNDYQMLVDFIKVWVPETPSLIVSGGAIGADALGERYAIEYNIPTMIIRPDWDTHGKAAGFIRNADIIRESDIVIAFWDGRSKGTKNAIAHAMKQGKVLFTCQYAGRKTESNIATIEHMYDE